MTKSNRDALRLAIEMCRAEDSQRKAQIDAKLQDPAGDWETSRSSVRALPVAQSAPWQVAPCDLLPSDPRHGRGAHGA